jgi:hypothetical protein
MTPAAIIREAQADGVGLALSPVGTIKATGDGAAVNRWLAAIREHKAEIIDALKVDAGDTPIASRWLFHFADRKPMEVVFAPAVSHPNALACYPDAVAAEPQTALPLRTPSKAETKEITALALTVFASDPDVDRNEALAAALADPDGALLCYRTIAGERGLALPDTDDDRRRCMQCLNLRGRACTIAKPERGALVVANRGYWPSPDTLQRCAGYLPNTTDDDQRTGRERWPGL